MKISPAAKVGILTILSVVILIFGLMWLKGRSISAGERIEINFHDVDGMRPGSAVQMMGIRIGQVEEIIPVIGTTSSHVSVKFVITESGVTIPHASTISIQQSGIIGEKFLEITPPQVQTVFVPVNHNLHSLINEGSPVQLLVNNKFETVGEVRSAEIINSKTLTLTQQEKIKTPYAYKINYMIIKPGIMTPEDSKASIVNHISSDNRLSQILALTVPGNTIGMVAESNGQYTIIEPMRLKQFFDIQLKSAVALQETNDKINELLSNESISDLKATLKNTKQLTAEANITLEQATRLLSNSKNEVDNVVGLATNLSNKMIILADNVNSIIGDPEIKKNLLATTSSIQKSAKNISDMLDDPKFRETLTLVNTTSKDLSEMAGYMNNLTKDQELKLKLDNTVVNLNTSLIKLSQILENVNLDKNQKAELKGILQDSSNISQNLKLFSNKLNKRFLLFRLMF